MKIFENEKIWKKLVIVLVMLFSFQCASPKAVKADSDYGGILLSPIMSLVVALGDRNSKYYT